MPDIRYIFYHFLNPRHRYVKVKTSSVRVLRWLNIFVTICICLTSHVQITSRLRDISMPNRGTKNIENFFRARWRPTFKGEKNVARRYKFLTLQSRYRAPLISLNFQKNRRTEITPYNSDGNWRVRDALLHIKTQKSYTPIPRSVSLAGNSCECLFISCTR